MKNKNKFSFVLSVFGLCALRRDIATFSDFVGLTDYNGKSCSASVVDFVRVMCNRTILINVQNQSVSSIFYN